MEMVVEEEIVGINMIKTSTNLCARCGKQRIVVKSYQETVGNSVIIHSEMTCPDPDCQSKLDKSLDMERQKRQSAIASNDRKSGSPFHRK